MPKNASFFKLHDWIKTLSFQIKALKNILHVNKHLPIMPSLILISYLFTGSLKWCSFTCCSLAKGNPARTMCSWNTWRFPNWYQDPSVLLQLAARHQTMLQAKQDYHGYKLFQFQFYFTEYSAKCPHMKGTSNCQIMLLPLMYIKKWNRYTLLNNPPAVSLYILKLPHHNLFPHGNS